MGIGLQLAASTVEGWFKTWSVVPTWERFETLVKALGAEQDEEWGALHEAALTADRKRKRKERQQKAQPADPGGAATPGPRKIPVLVCTLSAIIVVGGAIFVYSFYDGTPSAGKLLCANVTKEPTGVYPDPDAGTAPIKFKYLNDPIKILDEPHPPGWVLVRTPKNDPGVNWMEANALTQPVPCES